MLHVRRFVQFGLLLACFSLAQGCAYLASSKFPPVTGPAKPFTEFTPAGVWIYEDKNAIGEAELDASGNGNYPWKQGYFITETWEGGVWKGTWHQPGNDREGGFEGQISPDHDFVDGRWWYTRIGDDIKPSRKGGKFTLMRVSP